jgi:methyl-accepting chemotaxis protein
MRPKKFKNWSLFSKIAAISVVTIVLLVGSISFFVIPVMENNLMRERQAGLENVVNLTYSLLAKYEQQVRGGEMSQQEAMAEAKKDISRFRYGASQSEYLFLVNVDDITIVMHPIKPSLDGQDVSQTKDKKGKRLFFEMASVCRQQPDGFVEYFWPKPGFDEAVPKLTYIKLFEPWGWIAGTGVYIDDVASQISAIKMKIYGFLMFSILVSLGLAFFVARRISTKMKMGVALAEKIAAGDLTGHLDIRQEDEVGVLAGALNHMADKLVEMFFELSGNARQLSSSSTDLAAVSEQLNSAAAQTSDRVDTISSAVEEMNASVTSISASAEQSLIGVDVVTAAAKEMNGTFARITQETEAADKISKEAVENVSQTLDAIHLLGTAASEIDKVTDTIFEISEQTNLLALNATIEAARAGDAGRGFAVVAAEIKELAKQTTQATSEIERKIKGIQGATRDAVQQINSISDIINALNQSVSSVTRALHDQSANTDEIVSSVTQVHQGIGEISANLAHVVASSDHIASDIANVNINSKETSDGSRQVNRSAEGLSQMSAELNQSVNRFRFAQ